MRGERRLLLSPPAPLDVSFIENMDISEEGEAGLQEASEGSRRKGRRGQRAEWRGKRYKQASLPPHQSQVETLEQVCLLPGNRRELELQKELRKACSLKPPQQLKDNAEEVRDNLRA